MILLHTDPNGSVFVPLYPQLEREIIQTSEIQMFRTNNEIQSQENT